MNISKVLITGSCGLVGSEAVRYFTNLRCQVSGIDNNLREAWFGEGGDTSVIKNSLKLTPNYRHITLDITNEHLIREMFKEIQPDLIIHAAGQPSHDKSMEIPLADFKVNALGTINLLESARTMCPNAIFVFVSTNKVYGSLERPRCGGSVFARKLNLKEGEKRFHIEEMIMPVGRDPFWNNFDSGFDEEIGIDNETHTPFGVSKASADLMVQEYSRCFGMKTACFRCGCITGANHQGVEQHGFLSYLCKCAKEGKKYTIYGYEGKQVRDNIHAYDLVRAIHEYAKDPKNCVFNMGGGFDNSCSILEAMDVIKEKTGVEVQTENGPQRLGDHLVYYTNLEKFKRSYPEWEITRNLDSIFDELLLDDENVV